MFRYFFEMATDTDFSSIWVGFGLQFRRLFFGAKIATSGNKNNIGKHDCKKVTQEKKRSRGTPPCPPLKEQFQDWQQGQGTRDTPLVPDGTVADF